MHARADIRGMRDYLLTYSTPPSRSGAKSAPDLIMGVCGYASVGRSGTSAPNTSPPRSAIPPLPLAAPADLSIRPLICPNKMPLLPKEE
eukprot:2898941-Karenia_brevis.AAC.1